MLSGFLMLPISAIRRVWFRLVFLDRFIITSFPFSHGHAAEDARAFVSFNWIIRFRVPCPATGVRPRCRGFMSGVLCMAREPICQSVDCVGTSAARQLRGISRQSEIFDEFG